MDLYFQYQWVPNYKPNYLLFVSPSSMTVLKPSVLNQLLQNRINFGLFSRSIGWLRLLHHCLTHVGDLEAMMASAAAPTANLLQTCAALLMSPYCGMHSPNIEAVLVKIGLQSTRIGLKLIDILLRNCAASGTDPASESHNGTLMNLPFCLCF